MKSFSIYILVSEWFSIPCKMRPQIILFLLIFTFNLFKVRWIEIKSLIIHYTMSKLKRNKYKYSYSERERESYRNVAKQTTDIQWKLLFLLLGLTWELQSILSKFFTETTTKTKALGRFSMFSLFILCGSFSTLSRKCDWQNS